MNAAAQIERTNLDYDRETHWKEMRKALCLAGIVFVPIFGMQLGAAYSHFINVHHLQWLPLGFNFFWDLGLFLTPYLPYLACSLIGLGCIFLLPTFSIGLFYYLMLYRKLQWFFYIIAALLVFQFGSTPFTSMHKEQCARNYLKAEAYIGQTVPKETFLAECGQPAFYKNVGAASHWAYTDGNAIIPVRFNGDNAVVSDNVYPLFD